MSEIAEPQLPHPARTRERTMCRMCNAQCCLVVELEDGRPTKVYGDKDNPISHG